MVKRLTTVNPDLVREMRWAIGQVRALVQGNLVDGDTLVPKAPDDYLALTPAAGIAGMRGRQLSAESCPIYREVPTDPATVGAPKTAVPILDGAGNPFTLPIYNVYCEPVPGGILVPTALLKSGTRYVVNWWECDESSPPSDSSSPSSDSSSPSSDSSSPSSDSSTSSDSSNSSSDSSSPSDSDSATDSSSAEEPNPCSGVCHWRWHFPPGELGGHWIREDFWEECGPIDICGCPFPTRDGLYHLELLTLSCSTMLT